MTMRDSTEREFSIDLLRCIGAIVVMAAHVDPPAWLFQLRNFGTPLLIVVSAMSMAVVFRHRRFEAWAFLQRRVAKLTLPPWTFLTVFFGLAFTYAALRHKAFPYSPGQVLDSYAFGAGIGYVWIFRVYLTIAALTPLMLWAQARASDKPRYFLGLLVAYLLYEVAAEATRRLLGAGTIAQWLDATVMTVVPYAVLFAYGLEIDQMEALSIATLSGSSLLVFAAMAFLKFRAAGHFVPTQDYKYPPTLYYLSYAVAWTNLLVLAARSALARRLPAAPIVWISSNLLWIYLWHIMALFVWDLALGPPAGRLGIAFVKLLFVGAFGMTVTWLQQRVLEWIAPLARTRMPVLWTIFG